MKKINIIQFLPYFPPHKGGVETVGQEIGKYWIKKDFGNFVNVVFDVGQEIKPLLTSPYQERDNKDYILNKSGKVIGYKQMGYTVYLLPSFDIISNFPFPKFWKKEFWDVFKELKPILTSPYQGRDSSVIITHTRFFLSSFIGGIFAKRNNLKWVHIEHGSDYVKLGSKFKSKISYIYDRLIGKWIFKRADNVVAISEACKKFILDEFVDREVDVFYRGLDLSNIIIDKKGDLKIVFIGRLVTLKGVADLIEAFKLSGLKNELIIIGDGEEKNILKKISKGFNIIFLGFKDRYFILNYLSKNNCILVNPSYSEGMPTTVIEGLSTGCVVIASDVGGTREISSRDDLILFNSGKIDELKEGLKKGINDYDKLNGLSLDLINDKFNREKNIFNFYKLIK